MPRKSPTFTLGVAEAYLNWRRLWMMMVIREVRRYYGVSQEGLAKVLGCSRPRIAKIEAGQGGYSLEEIELLELYFGGQPGTLTDYMRDRTQTRLETAYAEAISEQALRNPVNCQLPGDVAASSGEHPVVNKLAISSSGVLAAILGLEADETRAVGLWDIHTGEHLVTLTMSDGSDATALDFSPDGQTLAVGTGTGGIMMVDVAERKPAGYLDPLNASFEGSDDPIEEAVPDVGLTAKIAFSPDGKLLAAHDEDNGTLRIWETKGWKLRCAWSLPQKMATLNALRGQGDGEAVNPFEEYALADLAFTPDHRVAVVSLYSHWADIFPLEDGDEHEAAALPGNAYSVAFAGTRARYLMAMGGEFQGFDMIEYRPDGSQLMARLGGDVQGILSRLLIVSEECVLAVVHKTYQETGLPSFMLRNVINNFPIVLPGINPEIYSPYMICIAKVGKDVMVAYWTMDNSIRGYTLDVGSLVRHKKPPLNSFKARGGVFESARAHLMRS